MSSVKNTQPNKDLLDEAIACEIEIHKLQKQLNDMQYRYRQALYAKAMAEHLALHDKTFETSQPKDAEWIALLKKKAVMDLQSFGTAA